MEQKCLCYNLIQGNFTLLIVELHKLEVACIPFFSNSRSAMDGLSAAASGIAVGSIAIQLAESIKKIVEFGKCHVLRTGHTQAYI
jgi:hypothetical protein